MRSVLIAYAKWRDMRAVSNKIAVFAILAVAAATTLALVGCEGPMATDNGNGYTPAGAENGIELGRINATWDFYTGESSIDFVPNADVAARLNGNGTAGIGAVWAKQVFDKRVQIPGTNPLTGYMAYVGISVSNSTNYLFLGPRLECLLSQASNELYCEDASGARIATDLTPYDPDTAAGGGNTFLLANDVPVGTNDVAGTWQGYTAAGVDTNPNAISQFNTTQAVWSFRELLNAGTGMATTYAPAYDTVKDATAGLLMPTANNRVGTGVMLAVPANAASLTISGRLMADAVVRCDTNHNRLKDVSGDLSGAVLPGGVAVDANNRVYIGDGQQVARYDANGSLDRTDILNPSLGLPTAVRDIKIDDTYNRLYVVDDAAAGSSDQILIYALPPSAAQGQRLDSLPVNNLAEVLVDCAVDSTNNVLYASIIGGGGTQTRIDAFDLVGTSTDPLYGTTIDNNPDATHTPCGITAANGKLAVGPTGNVFASQGVNGVIEMQGRAASATLQTVRTYQTNTTTGPTWANSVVNVMSVDQNGDIISVASTATIPDADHTLATAEPGDNGAAVPIGAPAAPQPGFFKFDNGNSNTVLAATWFQAVEYRAVAGDVPNGVANFPAAFLGVAGVDGLLDLGPGGVGAWAEVLDVDYVGAGLGGAGTYVVLQSNAAGNGAYWFIDM